MVRTRMQSWARTAWLVVLAFGCMAHTKRDSDGSAKRLAVGQDYYSKNMIAPALVEIERALKLDPENAEAHYMLGVLKMGQGVEHLEISERNTCLQGTASGVERVDATAQFDLAQKSLEEALKFKPSYSEAFDALAVLATYRKDYDKAIAYELQARENPVFAENVIAKANLAWAYRGKRDYIRAEKELREAVIKAPKFCVGNYRLGQVLFDQGDYTRATEVLDTAIEEKCPIQEAYRTLGLARQRLHDRDAAEAAYQLCVQLAPRSCVAQECRKSLTLLGNMQNESYSNQSFRPLAPRTVAPEVVRQPAPNREAAPALSTSSGGASAIEAAKTAPGKSPTQPAPKVETTKRAK